MEFETGESKPYERVRIPEDYYLAVFKGTRDVKDGKYGKRVAFIFEVDHNGNKVELATIAYAKKATPKNYLGTIFLALGAKIDGSKIDSEKMIGTKCRVAVDDYTYKGQDGQDKIASTITKVKPLTEKP